MHDHEPLQLEHFLPYRLSILSNTISGDIAREYQQQFFLSMTEWRAMAILARFPDSSAREVAERGAMDKVAVSRAVSRLVGAGRVSRDTHDDDRRRSVLNLTPAGWKIHDVVAPLARQHERDVVGKLTDEELATLMGILDKLSPV
ncbi:MAG TPA: MarR family winged helix-turn-helix transcriptional regulator [Oleiagrimonas sp.]|nr:MarR family winged helix-turn-helix transcriptional regulator [Oleiagrimonas sp.]